MKPLEKVQTYIDVLQFVHDDEWVDYVPIYYNEQRELIVSWGFNTERLTNEEVGDMFQTLIMEALDGRDYTKKTIELPGIISTCSVMEWIMKHGCPELSFTHFDFPDDKILFGFFEGLPKSLTVSNISKGELDSTVFTPVEKWHEPMPGMRRIMAMDGLWYIAINGCYYYMTN